MALQKPLLYGILHLGASSMSMTIVEYTTLDQVKIIEYASRDVTFGEELFQNHRLSFDTIEEICRVLKGYKRLMKEYGVTEYKVYGTAIVREADNRRSILDQIFIQTGFTVEVVDMPKEIYYKYFGLYYHMTKEGFTDTKDAALFLDITSGGVGITVWQGGAMLFQENVHIGTLRVMESFNRNQRSSLSFPDAVGEYLYSMLSPVRDEVSRFNVKYVILSGDEAKQIARLMGVESSGARGTVAMLPQQFNQFVDSFHGVTSTKLMNRFGLPEHRANILMPTLVLYHEILKMVHAQTLLISSSGFVNGVTLYYGAEVENHPFLYMLREQNVQLARSVAQRYHVDETHAREAERFGLQICDALRDHGITTRMAFLLRIAAILSEVGKYVSLRNHSEHGYHIVMGTDIFGLSDREKEIVANVVYYQYKGTPGDDDDNFRRLRELQKICVTKLVAILRIARALDASHKHKIERISLHRRDSNIVVEAVAQEDVSLEKWTFAREADYFSEVFGLSIKLKIGGR
ncbi:phosphatase [Veillonella magna]|uniref:Ppx/GppA phosphatase family protein n=1 Tax=Veillonella magna TaxID=464322 RepID=UPI000417C739|nr:phosphatase [Veillonella magna]